MTKAMALSGREKPAARQLAETFSAEVMLVNLAGHATAGVAALDRGLGWGRVAQRSSFRCTGQAVALSDCGEAQHFVEAAVCRAAALARRCIALRVVMPDQRVPVAGLLENAVHIEVEPIARRGAEQASEFLTQVWQQEPLCRAQTLVATQILAILLGKGNRPYLVGVVEEVVTAST